MGELLAIKLRREQFDFIDFDVKKGTNKRVNRKYNPDYIPSFKVDRLIKRNNEFDEFEQIRGCEYIFEFSNKSYYKELIDMINY